MGAQAHRTSRDLPNPPHESTAEGFSCSGLEHLHINKTGRYSWQRNKLLQEPVLVDEHRSCPWVMFLQSPILSSATVWLMGRVKECFALHTQSLSCQEGWDNFFSFTVFFQFTQLFLFPNQIANCPLGKHAIVDKPNADH